VREKGDHFATRKAKGDQRKVKKKKNFPSEWKNSSSTPQAGPLRQSKEGVLILVKEKRKREPREGGREKKKDVSALTVKGRGFNVQQREGGGHEKKKKGSLPVGAG